MVTSSYESVSIYCRLCSDYYTFKNYEDLIACGGMIISLKNNEGGNRDYFVCPGCVKIIKEIVKK